MPMASAQLQPDAVVASLDALQPSVVLIQLEIPESVPPAVISRCEVTSRRLILNASPVSPLAADSLRNADPLLVNEGEARSIVSLATNDRAELALALAEVSRSVVLTAGSRGAFISHGSAVRHVRGEPVNVVDTTGAGDAFAGTLAALLALGDDLDLAVTAANREAAWIVQRGRASRHLR